MRYRAFGEPGLELSADSAGHLRRGDPVQTRASATGGRLTLFELSRVYEGHPRVNAEGHR